MTATFQEIPIAACYESSSNPRKNYDDGELAELADSIREHGVLEPVLARAMPRGRYEIVCGSRRFRASRSAGRDIIPAMVHADLDDATALELQIVENGQRADVTPLEEGRAFGELMRLGRDVEAIADRIGRSPAYVRQRVRLATELVDEVRELLELERISIGSALAIAQLQPARQTELVGQIAYVRGRIPNATIQNAIMRATRRVSLAVWPLDEELAGRRACEACPERSAAQRALFEAVDNDDLCFNRECWAAKAEAVLDAAAASGRALSEPEMWRATGDGALIDLADALDDDGKFFDDRPEHGVNTALGLSFADALDVLRMRVDELPAVFCRSSGHLDRYIWLEDLVDALERARDPRARGWGAWLRDQHARVIETWRKKRAERTSERSASTRSSDVDTDPDTTEDADDRERSSSSATSAARAVEQEARAEAARILKAERAALSVALDMTLDRIQHTGIDFARALALASWGHADHGVRLVVAERHSVPPTQMPERIGGLASRACHSLVLELLCAWDLGVSTPSDVPAPFPGGRRRALAIFAELADVDITSQLKKARAAAKKAAAAKVEKAAAKTKVEAKKTTKKSAKKSASEARP